MQLRPVFPLLGSPLRHRPGTVALALGAAALPVGATAPEQASSVAAAQAGDLTVVAVKLRNANGVVRACLTEQSAKFPSCDDRARSYTSVTKAETTVTIHFRGVRPGRYGVALLHDENGNGKADRAAMMIPTEGFAFSRDAKVRFGPPSFKDAAIDVAAGSPQRITVKMRYLL